MERSKDEILEILDQYIHKRSDRTVMAVYLTDRPDSFEQLAEECGVSVSTVKRTINRCSFIHKYLT